MRRFASISTKLGDLGIGPTFDALSKGARGIGKIGGEASNTIGKGLHELDKLARPLVTTPLKATGKGILNAGTGTLSAIGHTGIAAGKGSMWGADKLGKAAINGVMANPTTTMLGIGAAAIGTGMLHDADGGSMAQGAKDGALIAGGSIAGAGLIGAGVTKMLGKGGAIGASVAGGAVAKGLAVGGSAVGAAAVGAAGAVGGMGGAMINKKGLADWGSLKGGRIGLSKFGGIALAGGLAVGAVGDAYSALEKSRMGQHDGQLRRAAPQMNTAGASGDLVFALHRQR